MLYDGDVMGIWWLYDGYMMAMFQEFPEFPEFSEFPEFPEFPDQGIGADQFAVTLQKEVRGYSIRVRTYTANALHLIRGSFCKGTL